MLQFLCKMFCSPTGHNSFYRPILDVYTLSAASRGSDLMYLTCSAIWIASPALAGHCLPDCVAHGYGFAVFTPLLIILAHNIGGKFSATFVAQGVMISL